MAVIDELRRKNNISELKAEEYAKENGLAHQFAISIKKDLKMAQLRKLFSSIKRLELSTQAKSRDAKFENDQIYLLIPEVAYAVGRGVAPREFYEVVKFFIDKIQTNGDYKTFVSFMETTIAYSRLEEKNRY